MSLLPWWHTCVGHIYSRACGIASSALWTFYIFTHCIWFWTPWLTELVRSRTWGHPSYACNYCGQCSRVGEFTGVRLCSFWCSIGQADWVGNFSIRTGVCHDCMTEGGGEQYTMLSHIHSLTQPNLDQLGDKPDAWWYLDYWILVRSRAVSHASCSVMQQG